MKIKTIKKLNETHIQDLQQLYQQEWWTKGRIADEIKKALEHSTLILGYCDPDTDKLIGFTRVLSDLTYKAIIFDVIIESQYRAKGLGKQLMHDLISDPLLKDVKHFELYCKPDMEDFYKEFDFTDQSGEIKLLRKVLPN